MKKDALQTHKVLYGLQALYPDEVTWLYTNETLSLDSINNFKYEEVNRDSFRNDKSYIDVFRDMIQIGEKRKEIENLQQEITAITHTYIHIIHTYIHTHIFLIIIHTFAAACFLQLLAAFLFIIINSFSLHTTSSAGHLPESIC